MGMVKYVPLARGYRVGVWNSEVMRHPLFPQSSVSAAQLLAASVMIENK
jgi:hypothetical protein